jgi:uncharacterized protein
MAHRRARSLKNSFQRQLKIWPVVGLLGPRQCGKSTFLRELVWKPESFSYETLDHKAVRDRALQSPELFLSTAEVYPYVIDEIQKAPALFDEIKALVDRKRIPGRYVISGSVQFSKRTGIRESLTGRISVLRMDTMTIGETTQDLCLATVATYLERGGMPGACFLRDMDVREDFWINWLDTICERDLKNYSGGKLDSDIARRILEETARLEFPTLAEIARKLRVDARRIRTHLNVLEDLFVVRPLDPSNGSVGKTQFVPFDAGLATYLGADERRRWQVWFLTEWYNQHRFQGMPPGRINYYLTQRGSYIDFVTEREFHLFSDQHYPDRRNLMTVTAALRKFPSMSVRIYCATDVRGGPIGPAISVAPWSSVGRLEIPSKTRAVGSGQRTARR